MKYLFAVLITLIAYIISIKLKERFKSSLVNPVFVSGLLIYLIIVITKIDLTYYKEGSTAITRFLNPLIVLLAIPLYKKREMLVTNVVPILAGVITSILMTFSTVYLLSVLFGLEEVLIYTLMPKSITTPLAIEASTILGGIPSITVLAVVVTGISGTLMFDLVMKVFGIKSKLAKGISLGATSHAIGTSKAIEVSEESGASSSLALGLSGIITVLIITVLSMFV